VKVRLADDLAGLEKPEWEATLAPERGGYFSGLVSRAKAGMLYKYQLDRGLFPDPVSRFQPNGPHGPSQIVDPTAFSWTDRNWNGPAREGQVIYEIHLGTFTPEGTLNAAAAQLQELARIGMTMIELMPIADFPGRFGWGYDGVNLFAPCRLFGKPDDLRGFVDQAHALGIAVILDVVYNHLGPDGNYLKEFSPDYFTDRYRNEWGEAPNFDGDNSGPVREFFLENAAYWVEEFHIDGLRLDATQQIFDSSTRHILREITDRVRHAAKGRRTFLVAENETQHTRLVREQEKGGFGIDALWNDDFHHTARVVLTGRREAYYTDYKGTPQEFISAAKWGYLFQGQRYKWQKQRRGTPALDLLPVHFVHYIESHDQVANAMQGCRVHQIASAGSFRAMAALLLLAPQTPMFFQGQEFGSTAPFHYFADHTPELAKLVAAGRRQFMHQFPSLTCPESDALFCQPQARQTFERCKLNFAERKKNAKVYALHCDLLRLRREDPVLGRGTSRDFDGAVLSEQAFVLRFFSVEHGDRLLIVNFGVDLHLDPAPEPLLAPMADCVWKTIWSSEHPQYGGSGTPPVDTDENWRIPGQIAIVLIADGKDNHAKTDPTN
jgi:maltooligosyltrehalose trehalohydrolase